MEDLEFLSAWLRTARRRIVLGVLVRAVAFHAAWALAGFALVLLVDRLMLPGAASWSLLVVVLGVALVVSLARTFAGAPGGLVSAAVEADRRLRTKERLSTAAFAMTLAKRGGAGEVDRAWHDLVSHDARASVSGVRLREAFPLEVPRAGLPGLVAAGACVALALWMPQLDWLGVGARRAGVKEMQRLVADELRTLDERLARLESEAGRREAKEAGDILRRVREAVRREVPEGAPKETPKGTGGAQAPKEAGFVRLGRAEEAVQEGRKTAKLAELGSTLQGLRRLDAAADPEDSLRRKLAQGRLDAAGTDVKSLAESIRSIGRSPAEPSAPRGQDQLKQAGQDLASLARELAGKLPTDSELVQRLAAAGRSAQSRTPEDAAKALDLTEAELRRLADLAQQAQLLDQALAEVKETKDALAALKECPVCGKPYCRDCGKAQCACKVGSKPGGT